MPLPITLVLLSVSQSPPNRKDEAFLGYFLHTMWSDVWSKELDSLGGKDCFAPELVLTFQEDVEAIMLLTRNRVCMRRDM